LWVNLLHGGCAGERGRWAGDEDDESPLPGGAGTQAVTEDRVRLSMVVNVSTGCVGYTATLSARAGNGLVDLHPIFSGELPNLRTIVSDKEAACHCAVALKTLNCSAVSRAVSDRSPPVAVPAGMTSTPASTRLHPLALLTSS
jgi:hypothetical protein